MADPRSVGSIWHGSGRQHLTASYHHSFVRVTPAIFALAYVALMCVSCYLRWSIIVTRDIAMNPVRSNGKPLWWTKVICSASLFVVLLIHPLLFTSVILGGIIGGGLSSLSPALPHGETQNNTIQMRIRMLTLIRKRWKPVLIACVVLVAVTLLYAFNTTSGIMPVFQRRFDRDKWVASAKFPSPDNPRGRMVLDLKVRYLRKGLTPAEVIALLGPPEHKIGDIEYSYQLGMWTGFRMDYDTLDVRFSGSGGLTDARVVQH